MRGALTRSGTSPLPQRPEERSITPSGPAPASRDLRVLMLASDAHGGFGGISQYNRDVLEALSGLDRVAEVVVLPRAVREPVIAAPAKVRYDLAGAGGLLPFLARSAAQGLAGGRLHLVYCAHINLMPVAALIARARRIPLVLAIYGIDAWQRPASRLATASLRAADLVISISQITLDRFRAWSGGPGAAAVVPNAIRPQCYGPGPKAADLVERHGLAGRKVIMTLGRMSPTERYKGFDEVIGVLPRLRAAEPGIVYLAAGDGDDRPRLEAEARQAGVADIVIFPGRIPDARKADYYRLADAYVMPSSGEGFGFVVLEALACGVPVVASAADGTREAVLDGTLGAVVDPGDPAALQTAIQTALRQPKRVPRGLEFFSFENFAARLGLALTRVVDI